MSEDRKLQGQREKTDNAFVLNHFGNNPDFFRATLFFVRNLAMHTNNNIVWMFSELDTPPEFVDCMRALVFDVVPYNESERMPDIFEMHGGVVRAKIDVDPPNNGMLRTCNFLFAYDLHQYDKVCVVENDMIVMKNIDDIFGMQSPAMRSFYGSSALEYSRKYDPDKNAKEPRAREQVVYCNSPGEVMAHCHFHGLSNGGVMLFSPLADESERAIALLRDVIIAQRKAKYPNETLFELMHLRYYNVPATYNLSIYHRRDIHARYNIASATDVVVFHCNETKDKPIPVVEKESKNPWFDEKYNELYRPGEGVDTTGAHEHCYALFYRHFRDAVYNPFKDDVDAEMIPVHAAVEGKPQSAALTNTIRDARPARGQHSQGNPRWSNSDTKKDSNPDKGPWRRRNGGRARSHKRGRGVSRMHRTQRHVRFAL